MAYAMANTVTNTMANTIVLLRGQRTNLVVVRSEEFCAASRAVCVDVWG